MADDLHAGNAAPGRGSMLGGANSLSRLPSPRIMKVRNTCLVSAVTEVFGADEPLFDASEWAL